MTGLIFARQRGALPLAGRSARSLGKCPAQTVLGAAALARTLLNCTQSVLILEAGAWLKKPLTFQIPPSGTGKPLVAFGSTRNEKPGEPAQAISVPRALYLEAAAARMLAEFVGSERSWDDACRKLLESRRVRAVALPELTCEFDGALRILQLVTTIQTGGAERITLDLAEGLSRRGHRVWVAALGKPTRAAYPAPPGFYELGEQAGRAPQQRAAAVVKLASELAVDLVHAHLISAAESESIARSGIPLTVSLHNLPRAWPAGFEGPGRKATLLIGCARVVTAAIQSGPSRTAWNGIVSERYSPSAQRLAEGRQWRKSQGWSASDLVIVTVANPRKQKRLERIPEILEGVQRRLAGRKVRGLIVGQAARGSVDGQSAQAALEEAIARSTMGDSIVQTGASMEVGRLLWASDVYLSVSEFEGLSLSQLEALAAGLPVVSSDVGGAPEVAREMNESAWFQRVPANAPTETFIEALCALPEGDRSGRLPAAFRSESMVLRMEELYRMTLSMHAREAKKPEGICLITNNFSMGGAQSSARRLLLQFQEQGLKVRAFTVNEPEPTRGSRRLCEEGVPVESIAPSHRLETAKAVGEILSELGHAPPRAVLFWNLIPSYRVLLADALEGIRIIDVSPGEMSFRSLAAYFLKPRPELPYRTSQDYGARLSGVVVKFQREEAVAAAALGRAAVTIRNGVALAPERNPARKKQQPLRIGTAARISPDKRLEDLLEAVALAHGSLPAYELHIAGRIEPGAEDYAARLRAAGSALPVVWRGELDGTEAFLEELDLFVMISEPAGCPNASLEAMAAGLPVIATDAGGASEQILDGSTGRLTARGDAEALARAICELAHDGQARARLGAAARAHVGREFSMAAMAAGYRSICMDRNAITSPGSLCL